MFWVSDIFTEQNINKEARECGFQLFHLQRFGKSVPRRCFPQPSKRTCFLTGPRFSGRRGEDSVRSEHSWQDEAANEVFGEIILCDRKRNKANPIPVPLKELKMLSGLTPLAAKTLMFLPGSLKQGLFYNPESRRPQTRLILCKAPFGNGLCLFRVTQLPFKGKR